MWVLVRSSKSSRAAGLGWCWRWLASGWLRCLSWLGALWWLLGLGLHDRGCVVLGSLDDGGGRLALSRLAGRWLRRATADALSTSAEGNLHALGLARGWGGVQVVLAVVGGRASIELCVALVLDLAVAADGESVGWSGSNITLELGCWWSQDTAAAVLVGDASVADAVGRWRVSTANSILAITKLTNGTLLAARSSELEAALVLRDSGSRSAKYECGTNKRFHIDCVKRWTREE